MHAGHSSEPKARRILGYVAKRKATGKSVRASVAHVLEISDGKIVRFDQYIDSATINPIVGA